MPIRWDTRNKCWRFEFDRVIQGERHRISRLLPKGWSQAEADAFDRTESARIYAIATGVRRRDALISEAVVAYLTDRSDLKSYKATAEHLAAIAWAYDGRPMSALHDVAQKVTEHESARGMKPATIRNRLACLKAACRYGWKVKGMCESDPTARMVMPAVNNARHAYPTRRDMLRACRACTNWQAQIAIRVAFYTGMRLSEIMRAEPRDGLLMLADTKNGERRAVPIHPRIAHLVRFLPLPGPKITIQRAWERAKNRVGLDYHFHDLRHAAASEMVNAGIDLHTVGRVLGHRDSRSTMRYSHLTAESLAAAVGAIGRRKAA